VIEETLSSINHMIMSDEEFRTVSLYCALRKGILQLRFEEFYKCWWTEETRLFNGVTYRCVPATSRIWFGTFLYALY